MSVLSTGNLWYHYADGAEVLMGINLSVRRGETVAILGRNASGKSTLLRLLAGLLKPTLGEVLIDGVPVHRIRDRTGIVFQNPDHQMIAGTVEEELALGLEMRAVPREIMKPRVAELLQRFGLDSLRQMAPEALSGGQKQRVALAAVMITRPDFLLFDEPDSLLDAPSRADLESAMAGLRESCGIVWTSPHPRRLPPANRAYELRDGLLHSL